MQNIIFASKSDGCLPRYCSVCSRVVRVTGPLRAMSWNVAVPLRLCFQLRVPKSTGQSILATWLNSSPFLSDNALNCFCWFTVLKVHQSYGSWHSINHHWRAPPRYVHDTDTLLLPCFMKKVSITFIALAFVGQKFYPKIFEVLRTGHY